MLLRVPHIGVGFGLRHLFAGHPLVGLVVLALVIGALVMADRARRR